MFEPQKHKKEEFSKSVWGEILLKDLKENLLDGIYHLKIQKEKLEKYEAMEKSAQIIRK